MKCMIGQPVGRAYDTYASAACAPCGRSAGVHSAYSTPRRHDLSVAACQFTQRRSSALAIVATVDASSTGCATSLPRIRAAANYGTSYRGPSDSNAY